MSCVPLFFVIVLLISIFLIVAGSDSDAISAVVILCFNRPHYLERSLTSLQQRWTEDYEACLERGQAGGSEHYKNHSNTASESIAAHCARRFIVFVSQDGDDESVSRLASSFCIDNKNKKSTFRCHHLTWSRENDSVKLKKVPRHLQVYHHISRHYYKILYELFNVRKFHKVIILEDDMEFAIDFFEYFAAMAIVLEVDNNKSNETLLCVSSWNDNGQAQHVADASAVLRSDFFPGLGWMLSNRVWQTLEPQWPDAYWDDWMRSPEVRKGRQSIRPEVCRTYNFGEIGASRGQFHKLYLEDIKLNEVFVKFTSANLDYLEKSLYSSLLRQAVCRAQQIHVDDIESLRRSVQNISAYDSRKFNDTSTYSLPSFLNIWDASHTRYVIEYCPHWVDGSMAQAKIGTLHDTTFHDCNGRHNDFERIALRLGLFANIKAGVPRAAYNGIVTFSIGQHVTVFLKERGDTFCAETKFINNTIYSPPRTQYEVREEF